MKSAASFSRPILGATFAILATLMATARSAPELTVQGPRGERAPLAISAFETKIVFFEDLAETTITVTFFNPSKRAIEGEFSMPLPPGATVSGYALDVKGVMRDSSVVEKERARFAYESIKRQMIDPGFVEREEGNVYRTKIFPIPAKDTKAVRLSYCEVIDPKNGHFDYELPLPQVETPSCKIIVEHLESKNISIQNSGELVFKNESPGLYRADADRQQLPPKLTVRLPKPASSELIKAGKYSYFRKTTDQEEKPLIPGNSTAIQIVWDCSESMRQRNPTKEFAFLDSLFAKHPNLKIQLTLLRLRTEPGGDFIIKNGDWSGLKKVLSNVFYDGANNLAAIPSGDLPTLLFSDGHSHLAFLENKWTSPVTLVDSLGKASSYWKQQAWLSEGSWINLAADPKLKSSNQIQRHFSSLKDGELIPQNQEGRSVNEPRIIKLISTLWAQKKLSELEAAFIPDSKQIIAHCKKHHLVSDLTSLIVLERFSDYVRYRIPPPEPDLRAKYHAEIDRKSDRRRLAEKISDIWKWRKTWHSTHFPWQERLLVPAIRRMTIWRKALEKTFTPDELNPAVSTTINSLEKEISTLFKARRETPFTTDAEYRAWLKQLGATSKNIQKIHTIPAGAITPENKMAVAVNGMVNQPGKIISNPNLTLLNAVKKAGGISSFGSGSRVSVYRGAKKTTYNTLSKQYDDVPLKPGDLIVVEQEMQAWDESFDVDPFSSDRDLTRRSFNHADEPAIVENPNDDFISRSGAGGGGGDSDPFGGAPAKKAGEKIIFTKIPRAPGLALNLIKDAMEGGKSPEAVYQSLRLKDRYEDDFYLNLGDLLFEKKEAALANRVLSNLIESPSPKPAAYRKWAYLLAKHSDWKGAREILNAIALHFPDDQALSLDLAWINIQLKETPIAIKGLAKAIDSFDSTKQNTQNLAELATVEYRRLTEQAPLPLDLRIVVSSASGQDLNLRIEEPSTTTADFPNWPSINVIGSRSYESVGVAEYAIRHAVPGAYKLAYRSGAPKIVRVQIYRNWRRSSESLEIEQIFILPAAEQNSEILTYNLELE